MEFKISEVSKIDLVKSTLGSVWVCIKHALSTRVHMALIQYEREFILSFNRKRKRNGKYKGA